MNNQEKVRLRVLTLVCYGVLCNMLVLACGVVQDVTHSSPDLAAVGLHIKDLGASCCTKLCCAHVYALHFVPMFCFLSPAVTLQLASALCAIQMEGATPH
jgi:hypothetical protein